MNDGILQTDNLQQFPWWRGAVIYQIYPRSFMDSNDDGIGDLQGIINKLDYIKSLNVDAIWISPFFESPMKDFGYDVSDYRKVDPMFGDVADFEQLIEKCHALNIKVLIDQVISHTSDQHKWFEQSRQSRESDKSDWYVWAEPKPDGSAPNNWLSIFGGPAWTWDARRKQYYLHNFLNSQPDLNFHNPSVVTQMLSEMEFWLELGVDGFRLDTANFYFHDDQLRNNPPLEQKLDTANGVSASNPYGLQQHVYDKSRPENIKFLQQVRSLLNKYDAVAVGEVGCDHSLQTMAQYTSGGDKLQMAYSFDLLTEETGAAHIKKTIEGIEAELTDGWPCWSIGNHDVARVMSRWGGESNNQQQARAYMASLLMLRGSICIYQGEELGLTQAEIGFDEIQDPAAIANWPLDKGRDGCRTPMPWQNKTGGGFSANKTWLPVPQKHQSLAVSEQDENQDSLLNAYRAFLAWRKKHNQLVTGDIEFLPCQKNVLLFKRDDLVVVINLSDSVETIKVPKTAIKQIDVPGFTSEFVNGECQLGAWQMAVIN